MIAWSRTSIAAIVRWRRRGNQGTIMSRMAHGPALATHGPAARLRQGYGGPPKRRAKAEAGPYLLVFYLLLFVAVAMAAVSAQGQQQPPPQSGQNPDAGFRFKSGVELINVTATVIDSSGRFVSGLRKEDFL